MLSLKALEFLCQGRQELGEALERVQSFSHKRLQMAEFPEIMDSILAPSGKGLRALLCLMVGHGWSCPLDQSFITVAAALETLHLASLQHDDVIDQSSWRRGQMSTPKRWGNKTAVLMGDYLLSQTLGLILDLDSQAYLQHFYRMARTLTLGQLAEIHYQGLTQSLDRYTQTLAEKTSALFQGACACSGTLVQADSKAQQALDTYGYHLGIAFQLHDDWLDYQGCSQTLGKKIGQDFQEKRVTFPVLWAYDQDPDQCSALWNEQDFQAMKDYLAHIGALQATQDHAYQHSHKAQKPLETLPKFVNTENLRSFAHHSHGRTS